MKEDKSIKKKQGHSSEKYAHERVEIFKVLQPCCSMEEIETRARTVTSVMERILTRSKAGRA